MMRFEITVELLNKYLAANGKPLYGLAPGATWTIKMRPNTNETFIHNWNVDGLDEPTEKILEQYIPEIEAEKQEIQQKNQDNIRRKIYQEESDPLFFKWQRGECDKDDWMKKVTEIKNRSL